VGSFIVVLFYIFTADSVLVRLSKIDLFPCCTLSNLEPLQNSVGVAKTFYWEGLITEALYRQALETSSWSSSRALDRPTPQRHWICSCQPLETDRPSYGAMVERRDGPSWLRDDDDDDV